jgi:hypothetical protein
MSQVSELFTGIQKKHSEANLFGYRLPKPHDNNKDAAMQKGNIE